MSSARASENKKNAEAEQLAERLKSKPIYLNDDGSSWYIIKRSWMPPESKQAFNVEWALHPEERRPLKIFGRVAYENRWSQAWGNSYDYSGSINISRPIGESTMVPLLLDTVNDLVKNMYDDLQSSDQTESKRKKRKTSNVDDSSNASSQKQKLYNGCLQNWYQPDHTIGLHADDERSLRVGLPIFSLSWGGSRRFMIRPIQNKKIQESKKRKFKQENTESSAAFAAKKQPKATATSLEPIEVWLGNGDLLVMGGTMQQTHKHEIPKHRVKKDPPTSNRISYTIRSFHKNP